jgi:hypothetical protein
VNDLYVAAARNRLYATQHRAAANAMAARVKELFQADADWSATYNQKLANGKWNHMADQTHIGYTGWQQPSANRMPAVTEVEVPAAAGLGVAIEGSKDAWPGAAAEPTLPEFDVYSQPRRSIEIFNRGKAPLRFTAKPSAPWIRLSQSSGTIDKQEQLWVSIDWEKAPAGRTVGSVTITGDGADAPVVVKAPVFRPAAPARSAVTGFVESNGYVSIEAGHYSKAQATPSATWTEIDDLGRTRSAMTILPALTSSVEPPATAPVLEYSVYLFTAGTVKVNAIVSPSLDFVPGRGLRYAVSFDDEAPQMIDILAANTLRDWEASVRDSARTLISTHTLTTPGAHTLKIRMVDPGVVLQKIVIDLGGLKPSYLGPPESYNRALTAVR